MGLSEELFDRAVKVIPGGVNSPVRAYGAIGIAPRFIDRADGCHIYDVDGKEYVDYIDSWGPMILGHNFPISMDFRGGKGIAASVGMIIAFDWRIFLVCAVIFFALFFTTHYVSLCSLSAYAAAFILVLVFGQMGKYGMDQPHTIELYAIMAVLTGMAFYRHRANIGRLIHGTENKVFLSGKNKNKR